MEPRAGSVLWRAVRRPGVVAAAVLRMGHQAAEAAVPVAIGLAIDRAVATSDGAALGRWIALLVLLFAVLSAAGCTAVYLSDRAVADADHDLRLAIAGRTLDHRGGADTVGRPGELVSLATVDTERVAQAADVAVVAAGAVVGTVGGAVVLLATSVRLGLVVLVGLPVVLGVIRLLIGPLEDRSEDEVEAVAETAAAATDLMVGLRVLKGLGGERAALARYRRASQDARGHALAAGRLRGGYEGITAGLSGLFLVLVAWVGGRLATAGDITVGELIAAVGLTEFLAGPLNSAASATADLAEARASARRVAELLAAPARVEDGPARLPAPLRGDLAVRALSSGSLRGLTFEVAAGELVGIVAPEPADATSLLSCLSVTAPPESGEVSLDGVALHRLPLDDARAAVLVAHHDAVLFEGTVHDNVTVASAGDPTAALAASCADESIRAVPGGAAGEVGERGRALSGGQRQRIALARALATNAPVLVVHDPTTAVDSVTEHRIAAGLRQVRAGRTTVMVTTSPALLAAADRVVFVRDGAVAAVARHSDLAAGDAAYRDAVLA